MTTVGEILKNKRLEKKLSISDVEKAIKVRGKFVEAIENNKFGELPPPTFTRGFIKNYAFFLDLPAEQILAFYRRQENLQKEKILPAIAPNFRQNFTVTPQLMTIVSVAAMIFLFFGYLFFQYQAYSGAPKIEVVSPADYLIMKSSPVAVSGRTDPQSILKINDQMVPVSVAGEFDLKIDLSPGLNVFTFVVSNKFNKETKVVRHVRLESP